MEQIEKLLKEIDCEIKEKLSPKRYQHSVGVMKKAEELALFYEEDPQKAALVGLAHDIAKDMSREQKLQYVKENQIEIDEIEKINVGLLHAKIGADICKKKWQFTQQMQNAILYHTTGHIDMDLLSKIILVADKTEEGRTYQDLEEAKKMATSGIDNAVLYVIDISISKTIEKGSLIHPDSIYIRNQLIMNLRK